MWKARAVSRHESRRAHENDRDQAQSRILFDPLANLEPANIGQVYVGKDEVAVLLIRESQAVHSGRRDINLKSGAFEDD